MTTSGTYAYNPAFSTAVQSAYARIGIRRTAITNEHLVDAANEGNFLLSEWSSKQPLLWKSELITQSLTQGTYNYVLPARVVMVLLATIVLNYGQSNETRRVIGPLSAVEYEAISNPLNQAPPTSFWLNRLSTPEMNLWPVPDGGGPYTLEMRVVSQAQDAVMPSGATLDIPYRALDAFVAGLAHRLSRIHAPDFEDKRKIDAMEAWQSFTGNDVENVNLYIVPGLAAYQA